MVLEIDHFLSVARGGGDEDDNLVASCFDCNRGKGAHAAAPPECARRTFLEWLRSHRMCAEYRRVARSLLRDAGHRVTEGADGFFWYEDGAARTLHVSPYSISPFIVRLYVDHYSVRRRSSYEIVEPSRGHAELSVLPDEVAAVLPWALVHRGADLAGAPVEFTPRSAWSYAWSRRAQDAYDALRVPA